MSNPANRASARASSAAKGKGASDGASPPGLPVVGGMLTATGLVWDNDDDLTEEAARAIAATLVSVKRSLRLRGTGETCWSGRTASGETNSRCGAGAPALPPRPFKTTGRSPRRSHFPDVGKS